MLARSGNDRVKLDDGFVDALRCGPGRDVVTADLGDRVAVDCETVSRRLATDRLSNPDSVHSTIVEPDSFSHGSTLVAVYQVGRRPRPHGAAGALGFSTTRDGGRTWRSGLLPHLTVNNRPPGVYAAASDPVIGYSAAHGVWLASSLAVDPRETALLFNRSGDGIRWSAPIVATRSAGPRLGLDKQWFTCDNWQSSRFYGTCYLAYTDIRNGDRISLQKSTDGGLTWSQPIGSPDGAGTRNRRTSPAVQPVVRPNGELLIVFLEDERMSVLRSSDGGQTLSRTQVIAPVTLVSPPAFRAFSLPTADVGADGTVYVTWMDCRGRRPCNGADLVLVRSQSGNGWSSPVPLPALPARGVYNALPGLAADPARAGRLALAYYRLLPNGAIDAFFSSSTTHGRTWTRPRRLTAESIRRAWLPDTQYGPMIGDYVSTSFLNGRPVPILVYASRPRAGRLVASVYAVRP